MLCTIIIVRKKKVQFRRFLCIRIACIIFELCYYDLFESQSNLKFNFHVCNNESFGFNGDFVYKSQSSTLPQSDI